MVVQELRLACESVATRAHSVWINTAQIPLYAVSVGSPPAFGPARLVGPERERAAWYWLTLDAVNFGSGWFPTLRKRPGRTGYSTVSGALRRRFETLGPWNAEQLAELDAATIALTLGQDPDHELMGLFARSLNDLGGQLLAAHGGDPMALIRAAASSATALVAQVADWPCFEDVSDYAGTRVPFYKRAQILAADLARAGVAEFDDLDELTMFADNLVPHVLRLDGILGFDPELVARIEREELIEHGSPEEVEIRACALHAVELMTASSTDPVGAAQIDELLWQRGQGRRYKASPRHRSRSTAY